MKKYFALILAVLMLVAAFAGCGKKEDEKAGPVDGGTYYNYFTTAATTVNPLTTQATNPWVLIDLISSSLYTTCLKDDKSGWEYKPTLAAELPKQVDAEGYVWEYKINEGMKWDNGDPITVDDFEFSFKMHADPLQQNLSASSMTLSSYGVLVNIYEYQMGEVKDWADVGYKKIDDYTFQATFTTPRTEYDAINACNRSLVNPKLYNELMTADKTATTYGTSVDTTASCGAYILTEWIPDAKYVLKKNPDFVHADWYHFDEIVFTVVPDTSTAVQLFENGELSYSSLSYSMWETYEDDPRMYEYYNDSLMYMFVNWGNPRGNNMLGNLNFRQALYYAANRNEIAETLGVYPAARIMRKAVMCSPASSTAFVDVPQDYVPDAYDLFKPELANQKIDKAYEQCGITSSVLRILTGDTANPATSHVRAACEMLMKQYNEVFKGKMTVEFQVVPANQTTSLRRYNPADPTAFDTAVGSLLPSAKDPRATFNYYRSDYTPPRFCYGDPVFDNWYAEAMSYDLQKDTDKIVELCQKMEEKLLTELAVVPFYETATKVLFAEDLVLPAGRYVNGLGWDQYKGWFAAK
ncbi:MAG: ABC transporter substrate-binding protein, partial [Clostridia bacterium]|nr:ABC transporter substrate-binding protein [Clostridia bacterium]